MSEHFSSEPKVSNYIYEHENFDPHMAKIIFAHVDFYHCDLVEKELVEKRSAIEIVNEVDIFPNSTSGIINILYK